VTVAGVRRLPHLLARRLPFYYGWVILACVCCAGFARQAASVAVLSIFVAPMTGEFGWSRTAISGAVSLGGILAAVASPFLGPVLDRRGARALLSAAILSTAAAAMGLSLVGSLALFYVLFCIGRMNWAGPFDLGIHGALASWFVGRRSQATSIATLAQMAGLVILPLVAQLAIARGGWRAGWLVVGIAVGAVGFLPVWLLLARRPEDLGLAPDPVSAPSGDPLAAVAEPVFTRSEALRTPAFWLLSLYGLLIWPVQAGVSLHQAPNLIERGLGATVAATVVSAFSAMSALAGFGAGFVGRRIPLGLRLALVAALMGGGAVAMTRIEGPLLAYAAAGVFGLGIGAMHTLLPVAWADHFGRSSYGAIRGIALAIQVLAQAAGPLLSGLLRDLSGSYGLPFRCFAAVAALAMLVALFARPPATRPGGDRS
jgi:sugar phosphate permease